MEPCRRLGQFLRGRAFACQPERLDRLHPFHHLGHGAQLCRRAVAQPEAPALVAVEEFIRAQPAPEPPGTARLLRYEGIAFFGGEQVVAVVNRLVTNADFRDCTNRFATAWQHHVRRIDQIGVDVLRGHGQRLAFDVLVFVERRVGAFVQAEADDHAVHCGFAFGLVAPAEGAVRKVDVYALGQQPAPKYAHLLALGDAVGGHKGAAGPCRLDPGSGHHRLQVLRGFDIPGRHKIQQASVVDAVEGQARVFALDVAHKLGAHKRRVAQHIAAALRWQHIFPIERERIAVHHMRRAFERNACEVQAKLFAHAQVHLVVCQPQRHLRNLGRKFLDLDAVELVHVQADELVHIQHLLAVAVAGAQHFQFQQAQFAVADHQKISTPAGRVQKSEGAQLEVELRQPTLVAFDLVELGPEIIQKQWLDELEDVFFRGVVRAQVAAGLLVHDALEQAAKDGRTDGRPVQRASVQKRFAHGTAEVGHGQRFLEQLAVHIGECGQLLVQRAAAFVFGRIEHLKELRQPRPKIGTVFAGALFHKLPHGLRRLEDARVVGEQAEQQAHQQHFQCVAFVAAGLEGVVQLAHALGRADVDRVLRLDFLRLVASNKTELAHMLVQVFQRKFARVARRQVTHAKVAEIAHHDDLRQVALGDAGQVGHGLVQCLVQILAAGFVLHQQHAGPEQVYKSIGAGLGPRQLFDRVLKAGDTLVANAVDFEEVDPERLGVRVFPGGIFPALGKRQCLVFDFVPRERHALLKVRGLSARLKSGVQTVRQLFRQAPGGMPLTSLRRKAYQPAPSNGCSSCPQPLQTMPAPQQKGSIRGAF